MRNCNPPKPFASSEVEKRLNGVSTSASWPKFTLSACCKQAVEGLDTNGGGA